MTRAVHRAGFRPLAFASRQLLLRPAALKITASIVLTLLALGLYSLSRGSYPLPASTLARALLAPQEMGEQPRFILFDIRLPRILMALLCGAMLGLAGAAMQRITRHGLADPGLIGGYGKNQHIVRPENSASTGDIAASRIHLLLQNQGLL